MIGGRYYLVEEYCPGFWQQEESVKTKGALDMPADFYRIAERLVQEGA